ncbi:19514_t:CDS:2 [Rhizophagus irregularis]|nr:19514_t:CDS:2 [Rhizophagus irregularis]
MVRKIILRGIPEADFAVYLAPDRLGFYYQYTELALGNFIDKIPQASYIRVSDKYVATCHLCNETDRNWISMIDQTTYQTGYGMVL